MEKLNKHITIEGILALLLIMSFSLPWIDMDMLVKVIGWDIAHVQEYISELTKKPDFYNPAIYCIYILPFLALISFISSLALKAKIARVFLAISGIIGFILSIILVIFVPNIGSGIFLLGVVSLLSIIVSSYSLFRK